MSNDKQNNTNSLPDNSESMTGEMQLGEILRDVGLISQEKLDEMLKSSKESEVSFGELLRKEVNVENLMALMKYEIPMPFAKSKKKEPQVSARPKAIVDTSEVTDRDVTRALDQGYLSDEEIASLLISRNIVSEDDVKDVLECCSDTGLPLWRTLLNKKLVSYDDITDLTKGHMKSDAVRKNEELVVDLLVSSGALSEDEIASARNEQKRDGGSLISILIERGSIAIDDIGQAMEKLLNIPYISLKKRVIDPLMAFVLPEHVVRKHTIIPIKSTDTELTLGMVEPFNEEAVRQAAMITGLEVRPALVHRDEWKNAVESLYVKRDKAEASTELEKALGRSGAAISRDDMSAVQLAGAIIDGAINTGATDVHLEPQMPEMRVRYRVDGMLYDVMTIPRDIELPLMSRLKLLSDMNITEKRRPQDGHFTMQIKGRELNFRTATIPTHLGEKMTIRFLDESRVLTGLKQLGLESDEMTRIERLILKPNGLILVTGPIGSGKTTTLYAALNQTDILHRNVMTIEDPVEYRLPGINQIQTNQSVGLTFESSLRSVMRQDADIIMVGEIRDSETARVATWAALTGQLVMGTLHTRSAVNAVTMMINLNVEPYLVASSIIGVIAQRLVRKLCPHCAQMVEPDEYLKHQFGLEDNTDIQIGKAVGCSKCFQTGYIGRTGIFEILVIDDDIRQMVLNKETTQRIEEIGWKKGMRTLWQNGVQKVLNGITSPEEIFREIVL